MTLNRRTSLGLLAGGAFAIGGAGAGCARGSKDADVLILGAGLAGLRAARDLSAAGLLVIVLEAQARAGGRLMTLTDLPGRPEAGGTQVGQTYSRLRAEAKALGIQLRAPPASTFGDVLSVEGVLMRAADWPTASVNPLTGGLRAIAPSRLFMAAATRANPFQDVTDWSGPAGLAVDQSAEVFLRAQGFDERALAFADRSLNANRLATYSMVNAFRSLTLYSQDRALGPAEDIAGGSESLTQAMAQSLGPAVILNEPVSAIVADAKGVSVTSRSGRTWRAPHAISTIPYPALRRIRVDAPLTAPQASAIRMMAYTQIAHVYLYTETPYWEADGLAPDMWTDSDIERVFAVRDDQGSPTGLVRLWLDGDGAGVVAGKSDEAIEAWAQSRFRALRPASKGKVRLARVIRWTSDTAETGGAYMHYAPGQIASWAGKIAAPCARLHWAGEHTSDIATGMEGALETGERAASEVLAAVQ